MSRFNRNPLKTKRARRLRAEATDVERKLWSRLRGAQMEGFSFRRQHPIGPFIADFYCAPLRLIIELDGCQHANHRGYDAARTKFLEGKGLHVIRFWNYDVMENFDGVLAAIHREVLRAIRSTPTRSAARSDLPLTGGGACEH